MEVVQQDLILDKHSLKDTQMSSSTISSLASPVDSGVQLLDSESELTSVMSSSIFGCEEKFDEEKEQLKEIKIEEQEGKVEEKFVKDLRNCSRQEEGGKERSFIMTKSDIDNQNIVGDYKLSMSVPNYFDKLNLSQSFEKRYSLKMDHTFSDDVFEMEHPIQGASQEPQDIMNVSLNSYELLDYTMQNRNLNVENEQMHVSMSEEVNENLKVQLNCSEPPILENVPVVETKPAEEQIVYRRQRKKKSKSDTPKKRVSFHEDILNSTKIDDIRINLGFATQEPDVSLSFFQRGFVRKPDVVKGRYSWAAEGDAPYYEKSTSREIKSDIYVQNNRYSSTSSSSTGSISSSIDEEDSGEVKKEPSLKQPKSSCLKKTKHKQFIDTNIVEEETKLRKKRSESNLLDTNIFGSLKNILNFSSSVPLAERGVPEGQEDLALYSSSHDLSRAKPVLATVASPLEKMTAAKASLKLTKNEGFYPNYPNPALPSNIIVCDSNVYEHKGISYSYEYENSQSFVEEKPKSQTLYQSLFRDFNFFRRKSSQTETCNQLQDEHFEVISSTPKSLQKTPEQVEEPPEVSQKNKITSTKMDWSDNETIVSDYSENQNSRHLNSPKRKLRTNHYQIQPGFKLQDSDLKPSTSKTSLINRFLRNVTVKKMLDLKAASSLKNSRKHLGIYLKSPSLKPPKIPQSEDEVDQELDREVYLAKQRFAKQTKEVNTKQIAQFRTEIFRSKMEKLVGVFQVRSAYSTNGYSKPLLVILSDSTLYIAGNRTSSSLCNHFVLPFTELNTVLIGPSAQTIHISNYDKDMQCIVSTGCALLTAELVGKLELAMRRDVGKPQLPAVKQLEMRDMVNLRRAICKQTSVEMDEEYFFYSIVNIQECLDDSDAMTPLGPNKEGPLMFKTNEFEGRWETAYFILKAGVLYMLSSASQRVPMRVFPLINGSCQKARRIHNSHRPHTFQLVVDGKSLQLAAPDEYVASEWLQELIHAASGTYNSREKSVTQSCSLLMTSEHILTVREAFPCTVASLLPKNNLHQPIKGAQTLSCASIVDLTSFRLPSAEQSWCILEFECREVHECSGDWILYFASNSELEVFISTLEMLWAYNNEQGESFPLSTIPETDPLSKRCVDVYTSLQGNWTTSTVHLQFL